MRIASLLPAATEIVALVGATDALVARSHECDFPESVHSVPTVTQPRRQMPLRSKDIHNAIEAVLQDALSVYAVDGMALRDAAPSLVITQELCDVCAVSLPQVQDVLRELVESQDVQLLGLSPTCLEDVLHDVQRVGVACGRADAGEQAALALRERIDKLAQEVPGGRKRRVLTIEWLDPVFIGGLWMPELVSLAGGTPCGAQAGVPAPKASLEDLRKLEPEIVLFKPCGFDLGHSLRESDRLTHMAHEAFPEVMAKGQVYVADGNALFNRSGPRLVESLEVLAAILHPRVFQDFARKHRHFYRRVQPSGQFEPALVGEQI